MRSSDAESATFARRLRLAVWSSWLAPYALFCVFAVTSASAGEYALVARLGPATFAAVLGSTLAAAICLSRVADVGTFVRLASIAAVAHVLFVGTVAFYDADMNVHSEGADVAVLAALVGLYATLLAVPFLFVCAELFAHRGSAFALPLALRHWLAVGSIGLAGSICLLLTLAMSDGSAFVVVSLGVALLAFACVVAMAAHRSHAVELVEARRTDHTAKHELEVRVARILMFAESITDFFFELDRELRVSALSDRFTELTGLRTEQVIGYSVTDSLAQSKDAEAPSLLRLMLDRQPFRGFRFEMTAKGRTVHLQTSAVPYVDVQGEFAGYRGCGADVTAVVEAQRQLRRKEAELTQAQKMQAVGQLTGGLAHDFNNLLSAMVGNLELLKLRTHEDVTCARYVDSALEAAARGASLTKRLLAFSRRQSLSPRVVDVVALLNGMEDLMRRTLGDHVAIRFRAASDLAGCLIDPHQLENAVLNVAINARDAMQEGGEIVIETDNVVQGPAVSNGLDAGSYVRIAISDNGVGIAPDVLPHVFEPFFTTKEPGRGSGLGLSMVYGFVQQSGGHIEVTSGLGRGTTVTMLLPSAPRISAGARVALAQLSSHRVLVLTNEPARADEIARLLRADGHRVIVTLGLDEARRAIDAEEVDLIVADERLMHGTPGMEQLWDRKPHVLVHEQVDAAELAWRVAAAFAYMPLGDREASRQGPPH